jgi:phosphoribosylamine--glycine ligase
MKILVVGGGGREHALVWAIAASPLCEEIYAAPGNAGIAEEATCLPVSAEDIEGIVALAKEKAIDLVVVGPEAPLVAGLVDRLTHEGVKAFGPSAAAAKLEGSKGFMKDVCATLRRLSPLHRKGRGHRLCPRAGRSYRRQGRWARRRQGRHRGRDLG